MNKRISTTFILIIVLSLLLSVFTIAYAQNDDLSDVSCAVLPDQILGQAHVSFAGAAHVSFAGALGDEMRENNWELEGSTLLNDLQYAQAGSEQVAIIIVDDFSSEAPQDSEDWGTASHGWLVQEVFERILLELPTPVADLISLETVDLAADNDFRSDFVAVALETKIDELAATGISRFVVNMSFVFVACEDGGFNFAAWRQGREQNPDLTLIEETGGDIEYVKDILSDQRVGRIDNNRFDMDNQQAGQGGPPAFVQQQLNFLNLFEISQMNNDPLRSYFMDNSQYIIVPIAAAGNFKWKRPFYPAQWPEVLSVSATLGDSPDLWLLSNDGEISAPGAYFGFEDEVYRAGTSFAAPIVSVMVAIDLSQANPTCELARNGFPELGSNGRWNNLPLLDAVNERC
jgi:Subtilase family